MPQSGSAALSSPKARTTSTTGIAETASSSGARSPTIAASRPTVTASEYAGAVEASEKTVETPRLTERGASPGRVGAATASG